ELVVGVAEMMAGDREVPAGSRVARSRAPIERDRRLWMQVGWVCAEAGKRRGRVHLVNRGCAATAGVLIPLAHFEATSQHEVSASRPDVEDRLSVRLRE